jgi:hypothetical protein
VDRCGPYSLWIWNSFEIEPGTQVGAALRNKLKFVAEPCSDLDIATRARP